MSSYIHHSNSTLFPEPHVFNPDRWLDNPKAAPLQADTDAKATKPLKRYLVPFSGGTRVCLGMHLAWPELYIGLATIFRRVELELYETGPEAVTMAREFFVPLPREGTRGVRVLVKDREG